MILRIWEAPVAAEAVEPFAAFMREELLPELRDADACRDVTTAVDRSTDPPTVVAVSTWSSLEAMRAVIGEERPSGVIRPEAERFLDGPPTIRHVDVLDRV